MGWEDLFNIGGTIASAIPGGGAVAGILGGVGSLFGLGGANKRKSEAQRLNDEVLRLQLSQMKQQLAMQQAVQPVWQQELQQLASGSPYAAAGPYDQYSPSWNAAATGAFRDDTAQRLQGELSSIDYYLRPQGGVHSSAQEYARAKAIRDANAQDAAFQRNLRVQGGIERYNNQMKASDERYRRLLSLMGMGFSGGGAGTGAFASNLQQATGDYNQNLASLGQSAAAIAKAGGLGNRGPRNGQTGPDRGNATLAGWNQASAPEPWGGASGVAAGGMDPAALLENYRRLMGG